MVLLLLLLLMYDDARYHKDPAAVASFAIRHATERGYDVVLVDTAGRMQNNEPLMRALAKLVGSDDDDDNDDHDDDDAAAAVLYQVTGCCIRKLYKENTHMVLVDTAGRMQNNEPLMRALAKLVGSDDDDDDDDDDAVLYQVTWCCIRKLHKAPCLTF
jgi:signal recognition particle GTPase